MKLGLATGLAAAACNLAVLLVARWRGWDLQPPGMAAVRPLSVVAVCVLVGFLAAVAAYVAARVTVEGMEHARAVADAGRPLLYAVCHLSCWELLTQSPSLFVSGRNPGSIYQPLANPFLNAHVKRRRQKLGYTLFDLSEGFAGPMKHVREQRGAIGVLVDQHAGDKGTWCPFFDRLASTTSLPALMALRCDAPLLPLAACAAAAAPARSGCPGPGRCQRR